MFKRIGRAFMQVVKGIRADPGYGIRDLSRGKKIIEQGVGKQLRRELTRNFCCIKCGTRMHAPTLYTAGVGQAYEVINPHRIERAFRY